MPSVPRPFPSWTGVGRRARWRRSVLRRVLAAGCAAGAVLVVLHEVRPPPPPRVEVVVAARAVRAGSVLTAQDVRVVPVVEPARQPGALTALPAAVGRRVGAALTTGEALTASRLVPRGPADGLDAGLVALHVLLADPASADLLSPGRTVALYPSGGGAALTRAASVLAVDPPSAEPDSVLGSGGALRGVVLALPTDGAEAVLAGHGGLEGPPVVNVAASPSG